MTLENVSNFVARLSSRTQFGLQVLTATAPTFVKPKSCPLSGRVVKVTIISGGTFANYQNKVNGKLERVGETPNYTASPSYAESLRGELEQIVYRNKKTPTQLYLKVCGIKSQMSWDSIYLIDGHIANESEMALIKEWEKPHYECKKQSESGLTCENQVSYQFIKLENVVALTTDKSEILAEREKHLQVQIQVAV